MKFGKGLFGRKSNGRYGRLSGKEILDGILYGDIPIRNLHRIGKAQFESMKKEYRKVAKTANSRKKELVKFLNENPIFGSSALDDLEDSGGIPKKAPENIDDLLKEYTKATDFLENPESIPEYISSVYNEWDSESFDSEPFDSEPFDSEPFDSEPFESKYFDKLEFDKLKWETFRKIKQLAPETIYVDSDEVISDIEEAIYSENDLDKWLHDYIADKMYNKELEKEYEKRKRKLNKRKKRSKDKNKDFEKYLSEKFGVGQNKKVKS